MSTKITFLPNADKEKIVTALLSGQKKIKLNGIEIILNPLKRDTAKRKEIEANKMAEEIVKLINNQRYVLLYRHRSNRDGRYEKKMLILWERN